MKCFMRKYLFASFGIFTLFIALLTFSHAADARIIFYGQVNVPYLNNTNVRWPDEPKFLTYDERPNGSWPRGAENPVKFTIIDSSIENNNGFTIEMSPGDGSEVYLRDDVSADEDLYFDIIGASFIYLNNTVAGATMNLKNNKIVITAQLDKFDERITSNRKLALLVSKFFAERGSSDDHYYELADETIVDIKNKTITITILDPSRLFRCGETAPGDAAYGHLMLAYVMDGETDLIPEPIEHASSSDIVTGDDTMAVTLSVVPASVDTDLLIKQDNGTYILDPDKATKDLPEFKDGKMISIPVFASDVQPEGIAIVTQSVTVNALREKTFADINILKARSDGTVGKLSWASTPSKVDDGEYYISEKRTGTAVDKTSKPEPGRQYTLYMGIKDNGIYDLDPTVGVIFDPAIMATTKSSSGTDDPPATDGSGGGGCNASAGFGIFFAALLIPFIYKKNK